MAAKRAEMMKKVKMPAKSAGAEEAAMDLEAMGDPAEMEEPMSEEMAPPDAKEEGEMAEAEGEPVDLSAASDDELVAEMQKRGLLEA